MRYQARIDEATAADRILEGRPKSSQPVGLRGMSERELKEELKRAMSIMKKLPTDILEFFRETGRRGGTIGGKRSLQTMTAEQRSERAKKAAAVSAQARKKGARPTWVAVVPRLESSPGPTPKSQALILANEILNRLNGYACKGSRARKDFYRRDLNWMADVLLRVEAGECDPLRPTGQ